MPQQIDYAALAEQARSGRLMPGNIDMSTRPRVKNPDGTTSTVRSISANIDGREVLIPTVSDDGRILSNDDAIETYKRTGKHLGMFNSPDQATAYAQQLHESEAAKLDAPQPIDYAALADQARKQAQNDAVLYDPNRRPVSAEDFAPAQRDVSVGNMLWNAAKSIPAGLVETAKTLYNDQRPEDVSLGPAQALAPLLRAAGAGISSEAAKTVADATRGRGWEAAGHAIATALPLVGPAAAQAGEDIGSGDTERIERGGGNAIGLVGGILAPGAISKVAPKVSPALATIGEQLASKGKAVTSAVGKVNPLVLDIAGEVAGHFIGAPLGVPTLARRVLAHVLDSARKDAPVASNAGGRLVKAGSTASAEAELADVLDRLRQPAVPESVELPPPAELPPGYMPRAEPPPAVTPANAGGRLVPPQTPSTTQALTDALAETLAPDPAQRVTTAPGPSLPPGYTPRSTVPKPKAAKAKLPAPVQAAIDAGERKRAYFLKAAEDVAAEAAATPTRAPANRPYFLRSPEEMAARAEAAAAPKVTPSGSIGPEDLPASWRSHTGQDIFPLTGADGKEVVKAFRKELKDRGLSTGQAIALVSKNKDIPVQIRSQLLRALSGAVK